MQNDWRGIHICSSWQDKDPNKNRATQIFNSDIWQSHPTKNAVEFDLTGQDLQIDILKYDEKLTECLGQSGSFVVMEGDKKKVKSPKKNHDLMIFAYRIR